MTVALKQMYPTVETDDEHDEVDETRDFGSGWSGLGIGRLLVLASVLALFISAGLWMLEAQFKKQEQAAGLDPGNAASERTAPDRPTSQAVASHGLQGTLSNRQPSGANSPSARTGKTRESNPGSHQTGVRDKARRSPREASASSGRNGAASERSCDGKTASQGCGSNPAPRNKASARSGLPFTGFCGRHGNLRA